MKNSNHNPGNLARCPVCDSRRRYVRARVVREEKERTIVHLTCSNCGISSLLFMSVSKAGIVSLGVLTDLDDKEVVEFFGSEVISPDCVIKVHEFLKNFRGSVREFT